MCSATRPTAISAPPVMLLYRPMVLPSRLARRGAGGTWKSTLSAAGDIICTFMLFLLSVGTRRPCGGSAGTLLGASHGPEPRRRGNHSQGATAAFAGATA